jgi:hypothetical protein
MRSPARRAGGAGRPPNRVYRTLFLGAGASKAADLPLTEELLRKVLDSPGSTETWHRYRTRKAWTQTLTDAFRVLYPDGEATGFRPSVVDFFTVLEVVADVHEGRERLPLPAQALLRDLRCEIALGLEEALPASTPTTQPHYKWFENDPPAIVITTNWDTVIERAALAAGLKVRLTWPRDRRNRRWSKLRKNELLILKLHGSTDWGIARDRVERSGTVSDYYSDLSAPVGVVTGRGRGALRTTDVLRYRSLERDPKVPEILGFDPPIMATMAMGKHTSISALASVWSDAYWALCRSRDVTILGYSFPTDDLEIRSLLRVTTRKAGSAGLPKDLNLLVVNPSPDAHDRARAFLGATVMSDYRTGSTWP